MSIEEKVVEQISEIAATPLKNFIEIRNVRKNMLANYQAQKEIEVIDQIMKSESISYEYKALLVPYIKGGIKKFYNQLKILDIALDNLEDNKSQVTTIDKDWINDFWEKAKNISDEKNQMIWGNVLFFNFVEGCCTKTLLNSLYLLDQRGMYFFDIIRRFSFKHATDINRIYSCIYYLEDGDVYKKYGLHRFGIQQLATMGLVEYDWVDEFRLPTNNIELIYDEHKIGVNSNRRTQYGNVRYTSDGALLFRALSPIFETDCFEYCVEKWKSRGVAIYKE